MNAGFQSLQLVEVECDRTEATPARGRVNAYLDRDGKVHLVGCHGYGRTLPAAEWYGFTNAELIGPIDESRSMEGDRIVRSY